MAGTVGKLGLVSDLRRLGVRSGDVVMVHSACKGIGADGGPATVLAALQDVVGPSGTLLFAAFNWDFARTLVFNRQSKSQTGVLADVALSSSGKRTRHPIFSFVVTGARQQDFLDEAAEPDAFGSESIFAILRRLGGKVLLLGVDYQRGFTLAHHAEQMSGVCGHRCVKFFAGEEMDMSGAMPACKPIYCTAYLRKDNTITDVRPMGDYLDLTVAKRGRVGFAAARLLNAETAFAAVVAELQQRGPEGFTCRRAKYMDLAERIWSFPRSLTGPGTRKTLAVLGEMLPGLAVREVPSGTRVYDWAVPDEWHLRTATLIGPDGSAIVDYKRDGNLCVVGYSEPIDQELSLEDLDKHLYSLPDRPKARPYVTSYYRRDWGFCLPDEVRQTLKPGQYRARIDSSLQTGSMPIGVFDIPGDSDRMVLFSTNVCHPSLAVNELSGVVALTHLARTIADRPKRRYTYRFLFLPETIGTLAYLATGGLDDLKRLIAGFCVFCVPDGIRGVTNWPAYAAQVARTALPAVQTSADLHSDDRQYASIGANVCGLFGREPAGYPEYHTSDDNLSLLSNAGFDRTISDLCRIVDTVESDRVYARSGVGEPFLAGHGLYSGASVPDGFLSVNKILKIWRSVSRSGSLLPATSVRIAADTGLPFDEVVDCLQSLFDAGVIEEVA